MVTAKVAPATCTAYEVEVVTGAGARLGGIQIERCPTRGVRFADRGGWVDTDDAHGVIQMADDLRARALVIAAAAGIRPEQAHVVERGPGRLAVVTADELLPLEAEKIAASELAAAWRDLTVEQQEEVARETFARHEQLIDEDKRAEAARRNRERVRLLRGRPAEDPINLVETFTEEVALEVAAVVSDLLDAGEPEAAACLLRPRTQGPGYAAPLFSKPGTSNKRRPADRVVARALSALGWRPSAIAKLLEAAGDRRRGRGRDEGDGRDEEGRRRDWRTIARWLDE